MTRADRAAGLQENKVLWENPEPDVPAGVRRDGRPDGQTRSIRRRFSAQDTNALDRHEHRVRPDDRQRDPGGVLTWPTADTRRRSASRSPSGDTDPIYLLQGEDDVEKSALAREFAELVDEGLRAFNVERIHAGDMTTGDRLADGVGSLVAAVRTLPMMAPRRVVIVLAGRDAARAEARERGGDARARRARSAHQAARAADDAGAGRGCARQAQPDVQAAVEAGDARRVRRARGSWRDAERWVRHRVAAAGAEIEPAAARL